MNWEDLRTTAERGTELALHSFDHRNYRDMDLDGVKTSNAASPRSTTVRFRTGRSSRTPTGIPARTGPQPDGSQLLRELDIEYAARIGYRIERTTPGPVQTPTVGIDAADRGLQLQVKRALGRTRL